MSGSAKLKYPMRMGLVTISERHLKWIEVLTEILAGRRSLSLGRRYWAGAVSRAWWSFDDLRGTWPGFEPADVLHIPVVEAVEIWDTRGSTGFFQGLALRVGQFHRSMLCTATAFPRLEGDY